MLMISPEQLGKFDAWLAHFYKSVGKMLIGALKALLWVLTVIIKLARFVAQLAAVFTPFVATDLVIHNSAAISYREIGLQWLASIVGTVINNLPRDIQIVATPSNRD